MTCACAVMFPIKDQCAQHLFYKRINFKRINLGEERDKIHPPLKALWTVQLGPPSLRADTHSAAPTIRHFSLLCLTRALIGMKFHNSKAQNLFSLPASWEEHDFFQECSNWSVYSSKHHQNHLCFFTVLHELEKLLERSRSVSKSKPTAVPLSKGKSQTSGNISNKLPSL